MRPIALIGVLLLVPFSLTMAITGPEVRDGEVAAQLVSPFQSAQPGQTIPVGVRFKMDDGWHIYWENPGDTGLPPDFEWKLPTAVEVNAPTWPYPEIYRNAHLVDYTYSGEVTLYFELAIPESWEPGTVLPISVATDWLMCAEICIPGSAELQLKLPVSSEPQVDSAEMMKFEETRAKWPQPLTEARAMVRQNSTTLQWFVEDLPLTGGEDLADIYYFSVDPIVASSGRQSWRIQGDILIGNLERSEYADSLPVVAKGILYNPAGWPFLDGRKSLQIEAQVSTEPITPMDQGNQQAAPGGIAGMLGIAFLGGMILNLMPCVFPVLGLKIMGFVNQAGNDRRKIVSHGVLFTAGVVLSFWVLAGVLLGLRAGGMELGWGFQLQSPTFVFGMAAFLFLFGLNLSGLFEIGFGLAAAGSRAEKGEGPLGSFLSGVLATVVATPCSAPFLAAALAAALTLPPLTSFLTFTAIALGLAAPYLILSCFPRFLQKLPKPGAWMESLKQFMAFPLFATAGWLVYVFAGQVDGENLLNAIFAISGLALAAWVYGRFAAPHRPKRARIIATALAFIFGVFSISYGIPKKSEVEWINWSPEVIEALREEDRLIYVDFTARWCATCQVNKRLVFGSEEVLRTIREKDVALVKADWTNEDPAITKRLLELGKAAVPVNLIYRPDRDSPIILPENLTPGIVLKALGGD